MNVIENTTRFADNDRWQILAEYTDDTTCRQWFTYGNYIDEVLSVNTHPTLMIAMRYYAHDHLYSPAALANANGFTVWERYEYDAYGKVTITGRGADNLWYTADDVTLSASAYNNPFTFTGRQLDILDNGTLHHMHYRHRDYSPQLGRFMQHDPFGYIDGLNSYGYVSCRPTVAFDPLGLSCVLERDQYSTGGSLSFGKYVQVNISVQIRTETKTCKIQCGDCKPGTETTGTIKVHKSGEVSGTIPFAIPGTPIMLDLVPYGSYRAGSQEQWKSNSCTGETSPRKYCGQSTLVFGVKVGKDFGGVASIFIKGEYVRSCTFCPVEECVNSGRIGIEVCFGPKYLRYCRSRFLTTD